MATYQVVYWRDIPTQVKTRLGRERGAQPLTERFMLAVDRAAMRAGLGGTDDYLAQWRTSEPEARPGEPAAVAADVAAELEAAYPDGRLEMLVQNNGLERSA